MVHGDKTNGQTVPKAQAFWGTLRPRSVCQKPTRFASPYKAPMNFPGAQPVPEPLFLVLQCANLGPHRPPKMGPNSQKRNQKSQIKKSYIIIAPTIFPYLAVKGRPQKHHKGPLGASLGLLFGAPGNPDVIFLRLGSFWVPLKGLVLSLWAFRGAIVLPWKLKREVGGVKERFGPSFFSSWLQLSSKASPELCQERPRHQFSEFFMK